MWDVHQTMNSHVYLGIESLKTSRLEITFISRQLLKGVEDEKELAWLLLCQYLTDLKPFKFINITICASTHAIILLCIFDISRLGIDLSHGKIDTNPL